MNILESDWNRIRKEETVTIRGFEYSEENDEVFKQIAATLIEMGFEVRQNDVENNVFNGIKGLTRVYAAPYDDKYCVTFTRY